MNETGSAVIQEDEGIIQDQAIDYPWLIFKLCDEYYTINTKPVMTIMTMPGDISAVPDTPSYMRGVFELWGKIIPLVELRALFGMPSLLAEYQDFADMLEMRKQDHLHWVEELKSCVDEGRPFTLATDPHKCAFGKWYDQFESEQHSTSHHLRKINDPHIKLHQAAIEVENCSQDCDNCVRAECLKKIFDRLSNDYVPKIVGLLDEAKEVFKMSFREMVIVLNRGEQTFGIITDEIVAVESMGEADGESMASTGMGESRYIRGVRQSNVVSRNILVVDDDYLLDSIQNTAF